MFPTNFSFWDVLMEDMRVNPESYAQHAKDEPFTAEDIGDVVEEVSPYWTEDTLVGEIVEEEPKALTGK
jgi:hypothetical protein